MTYGTGYIETECTLAAQDGNAEYLRMKIAEMLPNERRVLYRACETVQEEIDRQEPTA